MRPLLIISTPLVMFGFYSNVADDKSKDSLIVEMAKAFLQLVGVALIGGGVKFLYDDFIEQRRQSEKAREQERTSQAATNEIRKALLNDLIAARSGVEEARIKYRIEESLDPLGQYRTTILAVLDARLKLSRIWNAIETSNYLFSKFGQINSGINKMKLYLDKLINEYEKEIGGLRQLSKEEVISRLRELEVFGDYVSNAEKNNYGAEFLVGAYRPTVSEIRKEVLLARQVNVEAQVDQ